MTSGDKASTSLDEVRLDTPVTTVIRQTPRPEAVAHYEEWLREITPIAQQFAGHRGVNVIRPHTGSGAYVIVLHFDTRLALGSPGRACQRALPARLDGLLLVAIALDPRE